MTQYALELAELLVEEVFGTLASTVIRHLLRSGRLDSLSLKQRTQLDWRRLLHALTILIQQQLVFWYTPEDGYTTYEANLKASLALVKVGSYVAPIQERFGSLERKIISELALLGYATVNDIIQAVLETDRIGISDEGKGGIASSQVEKSGQNSANETRVLHGVRQAMLKLAKEGVLKAVNASHFRSPEDNSTEAERKLPPRGPLDNALKKGEQNDYDQKVMKTLEDWRQGTRELREEMGRFKTGDKRPHDGTETKQTSKKRKTEVIAQEISVYNQEISESFSGDFLLQMNRDKLEVLQRNDEMLLLAERMLGSSTCRVFKAVLRKTEPSTLDCRTSGARQGKDEEDDDTKDLEGIVKISTTDIIELFPDISHFEATIGPADPKDIGLSQKDHRKKHRRRNGTGGVDEAEVNGVASSDESDNSDLTADDISNIDAHSDADSNLDDFTEDYFDSPPPPQAHADSPIYHHLLLLSQANPPLLQRCPATRRTPESFYVPFASISAHLRRSTILATASSRYGPTATRLIRILQQKGRLDEKTITSLALLPQKTVRSLLSILQKEQFLELCEIPRDAQRLAKRSAWLWWWDDTRVVGRLLEDCYKSMANLIKRARVEREEIDGVIKKSEREDVVGKEDQFLNEGERRVLKEWREKEETIWGEVGRLAEMVSVLRDY